MCLPERSESRRQSERDKRGRQWLNDYFEDNGIPFSAIGSKSMPENTIKLPSDTIAFGEKRLVHV
jgi:hypothetical protein